MFSFFFKHRIFRFRSVSEYLKQVKEGLQLFSFGNLDSWVPATSGTTFLVGAS